MIGVVVCAVVGDGGDTLQLNAETTHGLLHDSAAANAPAGARGPQFVQKARLTPHVRRAIIKERRRGTLVITAEAIKHGGRRHRNNHVLVVEAPRHRLAQVKRERHAALC